MQSDKDITPRLWVEHEEVIRVRAISVEYAIKCGLRSWSGKEAQRELDQYGISEKKQYPGLPLYKHGTGIKIPHVVPSLDGISRCRIRLDKTSVEVCDDDTGTRSHGSKIVELPRYVAQTGVPVVVFKPPFVRLRVGGELVEWAKIERDTSISLCVTEAPLKAFSLSDNGLPAIGLGGVIAGPHVTSHALENWGDVDPRALGSTLRAAPDLASIDWRGRIAYICFDANLLYRPMVALGAARLAYLLAGLGADVRIVRLPLRTSNDHLPQTEEEALVSKGDQDQGPDDFVFTTGIEAFRALVDGAVPADPVAMVGAIGDGEDRRQRLGGLLESLYFRAYCHVRGDAYVTTHVASAMRPTFRVTEVRAAVKEFKAHLTQNARAEAAAKNETDFWVTDGKLCTKGKDGGVVLADFSATIEEEVIRDDGADRKRIFRIRGDLPDGMGLETTDVDADEFHKMEWVPTAWGARASMRTGRWGYVAEGIQRLSNPKVRTTYTHFGWRDLNGERAYLMPGGAVTRNGWIDLDVEPPEKLGRYKLVKPPATQAEREEALLASLSVLDVAPDHVSVPGLLSVYLAPFVDMLGPTFLLWLHGHSGAAKSTFASLLQCHYGTFDYKTLPETFFSTANALETTLWRTKDVVLTIDNLVPPQSGREYLDVISKAVRLIQSYGDGTSRSRLDSNAEERAPRPPRCMPIVTAEILPPAENISTLGRVFVVDVEGYDLAKHDVIKVKAPLLQRALAGWVQYLCGFQASRFRRVFEEKRQKVKETYADVLQGAHPRLPETLALFMTCQEFLYGYYRWCVGADPNDAVPDPDGEMRQRIACGLAEAAKRQPTFVQGSEVSELLGNGAQRTAPAVQQFLSALRTLLVAGEVGLADGAHGGVTAPEHLEQGQRWTEKVGWLVGARAWLLPDLAMNAVKKHLGQEWRWGNREFYGQLRPHLAKTDGRNLAVKKTTALGRGTRVWVLPARLVVAESAIGPANETESDEEDELVAAAV